MNYRRDIDGLRAVAVLAVMLFHFGLVGASGGYVGVDVFFCISGYLIGGIIIDETAGGRFSYKQFYVRRIKRLFPAFMAVTLVTVPMAWWLLLPAPDFLQFGKSLIAATLYLPNVFFYRELGGYFAGNAATMPLLHTWSLGVEEQFYIFFPLFMRLAIRGGSRFTAVMLVGVAGLSLAYAQHRLSYDPAGSFYWLPTRAWELLLGAFVAMPQVRQLEIPPTIGRALTALALAAILLPVFLYTDATRFPGVNALPPCLGTTWLLWWGRNHQTGLMLRALSAQPSVVIGRISYSLYLWHWPVYVFLAYHFSGELSWTLRLAGLACVFVFATLSYRLVEQPARSSRPPPATVFGAALAGSLVVGGIGLWIWQSNGMPERLSGDARVIAAAAKDFVQTGGTCVPENNPALPGLAHCKLGRPDALDQFLIWGDSHSRSVRDGADQVARERGIAGLLIWSAGCLPAFDYMKRESYTGPDGDKACAAQNSAVRAMLDKPATIRKVLLVGRWSYYTSGRGTGMDEHNVISVERVAGTDPAAGPMNQAQVVEDLLAATVHWLRGRGYEVYLLEQFPEFPNFSGDRLFQLVRSGQATLPEAIARIGTVTANQLEERQRVDNEMLRRLAVENGVHILPTHQLFCGVDTCSVWLPSGQAYFDNNHLTVTASRQVREAFLPAL